MMITLRRLVLMLAMILIAGVAEAAAQTVSGRVVDAATLAPLNGVQVALEGTNVAVLTAADGRYTIPAPGTGALVFRMIGYAQQRVAIDGRPVVSASLQSAAIALDEIVAVGYGTQQRASVSGAVSQVTAVDLETQASHSTTANMLAGMVQGISVRMTTNGTGTTGNANNIPGEPVDGRPGSMATIEIRNLGTPLFVIDGIPSDAAAFNHINASDIETISILKDAAAAVYGNRASNGVVLVSTKRGGRDQAPRITINGTYGIQNLTRFHFMRMFDAYQFLFNEADSNTSLGSITPVANREANLAELEKWRLGVPGYESTNFYDLSINNANAPQYNLNANISGGSQTAQWYLSGGHQQQDYNIKEFTWGRSNLVANLAVDLSSRFRMGTELRAQQRITDGVATPASIGGDPDPIRTILFSVNSQWPNTYPYLGANDEFLAASAQQNFVVDPVTGRTIKGPLRRSDRHVGANTVEKVGWTKDILRDFVGNFWAEFTFPFGTRLRATTSLDTNTREWDLARRSYSLYCPDAVENTIVDCFNSGDRRREHLRSRGTGLFGNVTLTHAQQIAGHSLSGTAFAELAGGESGSTTLIGTSPTNYTHLIEQARITEIDNTWSINRSSSMGGRLDYDYQQKYLMTFLGRYDGSDRFAPGQRWGFFPGVTAAWRVTQEPFLRNRFGFLEDLKVRASWGQTGSGGGAAWNFLEGATYGVGAGSVFDDGFVTGARPRGQPNLNLTWQTNVTKNVGFDALLFDGRVSIEADLFERIRSGIAATRGDIQIPTEAAFPLPQENLNADLTRGFEFALRWNDRVGRVRYSVAPNFTVARSKAQLRYQERYGSQYQRYTDTGGNTARWDGVNLGLRAIGQFTSVAQIESHPVLQDNNANRRLLPGDLIFEDVNGDGVINGLDNRVIGFATGSTPVVSYGAATNLSFEGLTLNVNWSGGAYFSHNRNFEMRYQGWSQHNGPAYGWDRWRRVDPFDPQSEWIPGRYPPIRVNQTGGNYPSFSNNSDFWRTNVKFLRVRTMELSYIVPDRMPAAVGLSGVRLFTNLSNPFTIDNTRHYMMDPEVVAVNGMVYPTIRMLQVGFRANVGGVQRPAVPVPTPAD